MPNYTISVTGPGDLAPGFEQMLDALMAPAMVGDETTPTVTLYFDIRARNRDQAVERAWLRAQTFVGPDVTVTIVPSDEVEGRRTPLWRRLIGRA